MNQPILYMIVACAVFMAVILFSKQLKTVLKIIVQGVAGLCGIYLINLVAAPVLGISVGLNLMTGLIVGVLGIPGFLALYIAGYML